MDVEMNDAFNDSLTKSAPPTRRSALAPELRPLSVIST